MIIQNPGRVPIIDKIEAADVDASPKTINDIYVVAFHSFLVGSTDGVAYGANARIVVPLAAAGYTQLTFKFYVDVAHDQPLTVRVLFNDHLTNYTTASIGAYIQKGIIPVSVSSQYGFGEGGDSWTYGANLGAGGYHDITIKNIPYVVIAIENSSTPTVGSFDNFVFIRS